MALSLHPFSAESAGVVSGWARTDEEVVMWCGLRAAPVPAEQINAWASEDWVQPFGLYRDEQLVAVEFLSENLGAIAMLGENDCTGKAGNASTDDSNSPSHCESMLSIAPA